MATLWSPSHPSDSDVTRDAADQAAPGPAPCATYTRSESMGSMGYGTGPVTVYDPHDTSPAQNTTTTATTEAAPYFSHQFAARTPPVLPHDIEAARGQQQPTVVAAGQPPQHMQHMEEPEEGLMCAQMG